MVIWYYHLPIKNIWIRSSLIIENLCSSFFSLNVYFHYISSTEVYPNLVCVLYLKVFQWSCYYIPLKQNMYINEY